MDELKELKAAVNAQGAKTPTPKRTAPSPTSNPRAKAKSKTGRGSPPPPPSPPRRDGAEEDLEEEQAEEDEEVEPEEEPPRSAGTKLRNQKPAKAKGCGKGDDVPFSELSEAAKEHRLRRMCERKPSGKIHVPQEVHDTWLKGGDERRALRDMLEKADGQKEGQHMFSCARRVFSNCIRTPSCQPSRSSMRRSPSSGRSRSVSGTRRRP